jgi:hypothetical protein
MNEAAREAPEDQDTVFTKALDEYERALAAYYCDGRFMSKWDPKKPAMLNKIESTRKLVQKLYKKAAG